MFQEADSFRRMVPPAAAARALSAADVLAAVALCGRTAQVDPSVAAPPAEAGGAGAEGGAGGAGEGGPSADRETGGRATEGSVGEGGGRAPS